MKTNWEQVLVLLAVTVDVLADGGLSAKFGTRLLGASDFLFSTGGP